MVPLTNQHGGEWRNNGSQGLFPAVGRKNKGIL